MISKEEIGRRIKKVREEQHLTLKNVEAKAGISATHISEIERGKTSPTIGALIRIADALQKDPAYFIEEQELADVSFIALEDREERELGRTPGKREMLTHSIPSGKINAQLITLTPNENADMDMHVHEGDEAAVVLSGRINFRVDDKLYELGEGDSIYYLAAQEHGYANASNEEDAKLIWFASERRVD
ncbi:MAG: helix-turn-helix transcriptional regulator [Candidatus Krumholzibacteriota bacterium]|nr:helix-turn-helix transcriptional regulator [Candidatus Krumholzibacteriota bacterium]